MSGEGSELRILLLGAPKIERAGVPLVTDTRKATALLAYLAVTGEPASRDKLSDLLWPETGQKKARAALRRTLSALAEVRSDGLLTVEREYVALDIDHVSMDVRRFRSLVARSDEASLSEAVQLYRDDFMAGFSLRDSAVFDDWQFFETESLRQLLAGALERLSRSASARGDWEDATGYARRWLSLDRLHEPAHRRLMEIHAWAGRRSAALKQYTECEQILSDELGVAPLEETTRLYEEIRNDRPPPPPTVSDPPPETPQRPKLDKRPVARERTLFGREAEWEEMLRVYGDGAAVITLEGEAGIGKTHLADEFVSHVSDTDATTIAVSCYESERNVAYGPFIQAISAIASDPALRSRLDTLQPGYLVEASRLAPELSPDEAPPPLDTPGAQSRFFEGMARAITSACAGDPPGVLFVDDVHLSDASSLELLAYLVRNLDRLGGMTVILTRRSEESADGYDGFRSEVRRSGALVEISIGRLGPEAVEEMARAVGEPSPEIGRRLFEETEGVPLFVDEYLKAMTEDDSPAGDGMWLAPGGVREVILGRLATVGETARQLLGAAAAVGRSFDFDTVREASGRSEDEALEAIEELAGKALISESGDPGDRDATYDFSHGLLREIVYEKTGLARRRILHRRIADYLATRTGPRGAVPSARIAHHYRLAGRDEEAARLFAVAGEEARSLYANAEAKAHFEAALELGHPEEARLREEIGDLLTLGGDYEPALESYGAALSKSEGAPARARIQRKLGGVYQRLGEWEPAEEHYLRAMEMLGDGGASSESAMLHADLGLLAHSRGDHSGAARHADESLRLAGETEDALTLARTHSVAAMVARGAGDIERARSHLEESLAFSGEVEDPSVRIAALNNLSLVLGEARENEEAISTAGEALALCEKVGDRHREAAIRNNLADLCHTAGREEESREHLRRAVEVFAEVGGEDNLRPGIWRLVEW